MRVLEDVGIVVLEISRHTDGNAWWNDPFFELEGLTGRNTRPTVQGAEAKTIARISQLELMIAVAKPEGVIPKAFLDDCLQIFGLLHLGPIGLLLRVALHDRLQLFCQTLTDLGVCFDVIDEKAHCPSCGHGARTD